MMKFKITWEKIKHHSTITEHGKYKLTIEAVGDKQSIENYALHCGNWPPNQESECEPHKNCDPAQFAASVTRSE